MATSKSRPKAGRLARPSRTIDLSTVSRAREELLEADLAYHNAIVDAVKAGALARDVAAELGVSTTRVYQVVAEGRRLVSKRAMLSGGRDSSMLDK